MAIWDILSHGVTRDEALWDSGRLLPVRSIDGGLPDSIEASDLSVLAMRALLLCMFVRLVPIFIYPCGFDP